MENKDMEMDTLADLDIHDHDGDEDDVEDEIIEDSMPITVRFSAS
jgi:hypothetical protein